MENSIATSFLIIATVVCAVLIFNTMYPAIIKGSNAMTSMGNRANERLKSQVEIIHAAGEADSSPVLVWVKNIGSSRIASVESCDVFLGPVGNFYRVLHDDYAGAGEYPYWTAEVENGSEWDPTRTLKISIYYDPLDLPSSGRYFVKVVLPNGVSDEYYFSI